LGEDPCGRIDDAIEKKSDVPTKKCEDTTSDRYAFEKMSYSCKIYRCISFAYMQKICNSRNAKDLHFAESRLVLDSTFANM
jgi:hypothetical protein